MKNERIKMKENKENSELKIKKSFSSFFYFIKNYYITLKLKLKSNLNLSLNIKNKSLYLLGILFFTCVILFTIFPYYYAILSSFKSSGEIFKINYFINSLDFSNYLNLFKKQNFIKIIFNSFVVSLIVVLGSSLLALFSSFILGRKNFYGKNFLLLLILCISMFPQIAVLSGLYANLRNWGLYNTLSGLGVSYLILTLPLAVWIFTTFVKEIPKEIEEAAIIDGANEFTVLWKIYFPLLIPAIISTSILTFIAAWNEFLFALTFTINEKARTIPVAISLISGASQYELPFGTIMAASVLVTIPVIILVLIFQKKITSGLKAGIGKK